MRVVVTGANGFVGRALVERLRAEGDDVVAIDRQFDGEDGGEERIAGDLLDPAILDAAFAGGCDGVVHLATIPGGAAEADPDTAWRTNVDGARALAAAAIASGTRPRFVFASSIAVLGDALPPDGVDDDTPTAPTLLYGAHKRIVEEWLATLDRRGALRTVALRLPGIVARPAGGAGLKSAFMSDVFHALAAGRRFVSPVSAEARFWLMSADRVAANLAHALRMPDASLPTRAVTLPALHVSMAMLVAAIARAIGASPSLVDYRPDAVLEAQFGAYPPLFTPAARAAGFADDGDLATLVDTVLSRL